MIEGIYSFITTACFFHETVWTLKDVVRDDQSSFPTSQLDSECYRGVDRFILCAGVSYACAYGY